MGWLWNHEPGNVVTEQTSTNSSRAEGGRRRRKETSVVCRWDLDSPGENVEPAENQLLSWFCWNEENLLERPGA